MTKAAAIYIVAVHEQLMVIKAYRDQAPVIMCWTDTIEKAQEILQALCEEEVRDHDES